VKLAVRLADLQMAAAFYPADEPTDLDKEQWNSFWQVWNVVGVGEHSGAFASFASLR